MNKNRSEVFPNQKKKKCHSGLFELLSPSTKQKIESQVGEERMRVNLISGVGGTQ